MCIGSAYKERRKGEAERRLIIAVVGMGQGGRSTVAGSLEEGRLLSSMRVYAPYVFLQEDPNLTH